MTITVEKPVEEKELSMNAWEKQMSEYITFGTYINFTE